LSKIRQENILAWLARAEAQAITDATAKFIDQRPQICFHKKLYVDMLRIGCIAYVESVLSSARSTNCAQVAPSLRAIDFGRDRLLSPGPRCSRIRR
jgi:hypothetical protein